MDRRHRRAVGLSVVWLGVSLSVAVPLARAQDVHASGGVNFRVASGTFGGADATTIFYAPAVVRLEVSRFEFGAFFPYLAFRNGAGTLSDGGWIPVQGAVSGAPTVGMPVGNGMPGGGMMGSGMMGSATTQSGYTTQNSQAGVTPLNLSGIGDVVATAGYRIVDNLLTGVQMLVSTRVKIPTASASRGLGTGRTDIGVAASARKRFSSGWIYGELGYVALGKPAGTDLHNAMTWGVGGGRRIASRVFLLVTAFGSTRLLDGYAAPAEVGAGLGVRLTDHLNVTAIPTAGLSKASPGFAMTAGVSTRLWER